MYFESAVAAEYFLLENDVLWFLKLVLNFLPSYQYTQPHCTFKIHLGPKGR